MNGAISTEEKIELLETAVEVVDAYSPKIYTLLSSAQQLLIAIMWEDEPCILPDISAYKLRLLIRKLEEKINRKKNYEAVMQQLQ